MNALEYTPNPMIMAAISGESEMPPEILKPCNLGRETSPPYAHASKRPRIAQTVKIASTFRTRKLALINRGATFQYTRAHAAARIGSSHADRLSAGILMAGMKTPRLVNHHPHKGSASRGTGNTLMTSAYHTSSCRSSGTLR